MSRGEEAREGGREGGRENTGGGVRFSVIPVAYERERWARLDLGCEQREGEGKGWMDGGSVYSRRGRTRERSVCWCRAAVAAANSTSRSSRSHITTTTRKNNQSTEDGKKIARRKIVSRRRGRRKSGKGGEEADHRERNMRFEKLIDCVSLVLIL